MFRQNRQLPIAIIGMACRLPGAANTREYWELLEAGQCALKELPPERLNRELYFDPHRGTLGKTYSTMGGLISDGPFDPQSLGLTPRTGRKTDAPYLTICKVASEALTDAKMDPLNLRNRNAGVFIGATGGSTWAGDIVFAALVEETASFLNDLVTLQSLRPRSSSNRFVRSVVADVVKEVRRRYTPRGRRKWPYLGAHVAAGIIAHAFGLSGPFTAVDAACASSLKALMLAVHALQQNRLEMAIVGGASCLKPDTLVLFSQAQSISANGSYPFDANADGLIASEGYVAMVLKTLPRALHDKDPICGVIGGLGMSTDGRGKSLWAPRKEGQILAIQRAYGHVSELSRVQYIEAHATSTQVGDATELQALNAVFCRQVTPGRRIALGSCKGNIGHTLETAGIAGLMKVALALRHKKIPPSFQAQRLNPQVDWDQMPFFLPTAPIDWEPQNGHPRRAAVNAFGIGGMNIHVVLEEFVEQQSKAFSVSFTEEDSFRAVQEPIAVIGAGAIFPGAHTIDQFWELLISGVDPKSEVPMERWNRKLGFRKGRAQRWKTPNCLGGFIRGYEFDWRGHKIPPKQVERGNPLQFMLLDAVAQALKQAGYEDRPFDRRKTGVVVGNVFGGDFQAQLQMGLRLPEFNSILEHVLRTKGLSASRIDAVLDEYKALFLQRMPALLDDTGSFTASTLASRITKHFDLMGGALALDAAGASGLAAISAATDILRSGDCDMVICAAGQRNMNPATYESFWRMGILADGAPRPAFDDAASGIVPGEGAGVVLLKRWVDAQRDGDPVRAVLRGIGVCSNTKRPARACGPALERALEEAKSSVEQIAAIETCGGIRPKEIAELAATAKVLKRAPRQQPVLLGSTMGQLGHGGAVNNMASFLKATLALEHQTLPVGLGVNNPSSALAKHDGLFTLPKDPVPLKAESASGSSLIGVTTGVADGQIYYALLDHGARQGNDKEDAADPSASPLFAPGETRKTVTKYRVICIGASSRAGFVRRLRDAGRNVSPIFRLGEAFSAEEGERAAIVTASPEMLASQIQFLLEHLESQQDASRLEARGIYVHRLADIPLRVGWMFPGQGSQYPGMLRPLIEEFPPAKEAMKRADEVLARLGLGSFAEWVWIRPEGLGKDVWQTQIGILLAEYILAESLQALGLRPDLVAGHSFGEFAALITAKAWSLETAVRCTRLRADVLQTHVARPGGMVAVSAPFEVVEDLRAKLDGSLFVANDNGPGQIVLSGAPDALARFMRLARPAKVAAVALPVPCPFHSPLLAEAARVFSERFSLIPIQAARLPVVSTAYNRYMLERDDIRRSLCDHLTLPVRYGDMVRKVADEHPTLFVEVGPQRVLTRLHQKILADGPLSVVPSDDPRRPGLEQLICVVAMCLSRGVPATEKAESRQALSPPQTALGELLRQPKLVHFDATELRRRTRRRQASERDRFAAFSAGSGDAGVSYSEGDEPLHTQSAPGIPPAADRQYAELEAVRQFMVQFIIEQTGYPEEMIELDADLEADLGIDSIKKAQLFGELSEQFHIEPPPAGASLDDFLTLRDVLKFLAQRGEGRTPTQHAAKREETLARAPSPEPEKTCPSAHTSFEEDRSMSRLVLQRVPAPLGPAVPARAWQAPALILGSNPDADALYDRLCKAGMDVVRLAAGKDPETAAKEARRALQLRLFPHLFLMTPRDRVEMPYADEAAWQERRSRGLLVPFVICQQWFQAIIASGSRTTPILAVATSLGGDFGFHGDFLSPEGGALAGLAKAIRAETQSAICIKVIDFPLDYAPDHLARQLMAEISADTPELEIGYDEKHRRFVARARFQPASSLPPREVRPGSTWLVTGGGRGVAAHVACELGRRFRLKLHLMGTSPPPLIDSGWRDLSAAALKQLRSQIAREASQKGESPAEAWRRIERAIQMDRALRAFSEKGVQARYHSCDVSDRARLSEILTEIRRSDGRIGGVIHGAGVEYACRFPSKQLPLVSRTIAAKVDGAAALMALLDDDPPDFFLAFGSASGRFGGVGQTDYSLANAMLSKLVAQFRSRHPTCSAVCLEWTAWDEIGMAARPESRVALEAMGVRPMPPWEGVDHLVDEMQSQGLNAEVLILDRSATVFTQNVLMSATDAPGDARTRTGTPPAPAESSHDRHAYETGYQYGLQHKDEILSFLRHAADRLPGRRQEVAREAPAAVRRMIEVHSEEELRGIAMGVNVAPVSLRAHSLALRTKGGENAAAAAPADASEFPLLDKAFTKSGKEWVAHVSLCPQTDIFLREHRLYGKAVLPAAVCAEILAEAAVAHFPGKFLVGLKDLELAQLHDFGSNQPVDAQVRIRESGGTIRCELTANQGGSREGDQSRLGRAVAELGDESPAPEALSVGEPTYGWQPFLYPDDWAVLHHGAALRTLREVVFQHDGGRARLLAPPSLELAGKRLGAKWIIPSALLDGCLVACGAYAYFMLERRVQIPRSIGQLRVQRQPRESEQCLLRFFIRRIEDQSILYDFHLVGEDGLLVLAVKDYACTRIETETHDRSSSPA